MNARPQLQTTSAGASQAVLRVEGLSARHGRIQVTFDVGLELRDGEILALLGPNGAGKSSLLGAIAGSVRSEGSVRLGAQLFGAQPAHQRARAGISLVPEQRGNIFRTMTVAENIEVGLRLTPAADRMAVRDDMLALFPQLVAKLGTAAGMLSGGEQQMLAIGMAIARKPQVLILDEPTQGLAPTIYDVLQKVFLALRDRGISLLIAEQNIGFVARFVDRYLVLAQGAVVARGAGADLGRPNDVLSAFLGSGPA